MTAIKLQKPKDFIEHADFAYRYRDPDVSAMASGVFNDRTYKYLKMFNKESTGFKVIRILHKRRVFTTGNLEKCANSRFPVLTARLFCRLARFVD